MNKISTWLSVLAPGLVIGIVLVTLVSVAGKEALASDDFSEVSKGEEAGEDNLQSLLELAVNGQEVKRRVGALEELRTQRADLVLPKLLDLAKHERDEGVLLALSETLNSMGEKASARQIVESLLDLESNVNLQTRLFAASKLARAGFDSGYPWFVIAVRNPDEEIRSTAAHLVAFFHRFEELAEREDGPMALCLLLSTDSSAEVRSGLVSSLRMTMPNDAKAYEFHGLLANMAANDPAEFVRDKALLAMAELLSKETADSELH